MSNEDIKPIHSIEEYQEAINEVRKTQKPIKVSMSDEIDIPEDLDMEGVEVFVNDGYDEIKPI